MVGTVASFIVLKNVVFNRNNITKILGESYFIIAFMKKNKQGFLTYSVQYISEWHVRIASIYHFRNYKRKALLWIWLSNTHWLTNFLTFSFQFFLIHSFFLLHSIFSYNSVPFQFFFFIFFLLFVPSLNYYLSLKFFLIFITVYVLSLLFCKFITPSLSDSFYTSLLPPFPLYFSICNVTNCFTFMNSLSLFLILIFYTGKFYQMFTLIFHQKLGHWAL